jgi:3-oxoacyl-[acyl-carrier protein] reductase
VEDTVDTGLKDQVVLITGASGGIGAATAMAFAREGARLVLHAHTRPEVVRALAGELTAESLPVQADLSDEKATEQMFREAIGRFGRIDVLVANAGVWPPDPVPVHEMSLERWRQVIAGNLTSVFLCARSFFRHLAERRTGTASMVIVGSTAAVFGEEGHCEYAASKAAVTHGLTLSLKNEIVRLAPDGRVNVVCPGWTRTPMAEAGTVDPEAMRDVLQTRSLRKIARAEEIASAIVFLASPILAGHVSGQVLTVAGGMEGRLLHRREEIEPNEA